MCTQTIPYTIIFCGKGTCLITAYNASNSIEREGERENTLDNGDIYNLPHLSKAAKAESKKGHYIVNID